MRVVCSAFLRPMKRAFFATIRDIRAKVAGLELQSVQSKAAFHLTNIMQQCDMAIPILPSRSLSDTLAFYRRLGFDGEIHRFGNYAILRRGTVEIHFFTYRELHPAKSSAMCYLRVSDVADIHHAFLAAELPRTGIPRQDALEDKPWGMREFAIVDADGNLLRIGQKL